MRLVRALVVAIAIFCVNLTVVPNAIGQDEGRAWLALGDSFSSGEGISGTDPPEEGAKDCSRATGRNGGATAYAVGAYAGLRDELNLSGGQQFTACTGAINDDVMAQIEEAARLSGAERAKWDIATLSFGGNSIGFSSIIQECLDVNRGWGIFDPTPGCDTSEEGIKRRIDAVSGRSRMDVSGVEGRLPLPQLYDVVANAMNPGGTVFVLGYPQLFEDPERWASWRRILGAVTPVECEGVPPDDIRMIRRVQEYFNVAIRDAVRTADIQFAGSRNVRFFYVDVADGLYEASDTRHGLCSQDPWLNGISTGYTSGDLQHERSFHPNSKGHAATAELLISEIRNKVVTDAAPTGAEVDGESDSPTFGMLTSDSSGREIGIGEVEPRTIDLGGASSTGTFTEITWQDWGQEFAIGRGVGAYVAPGAPNASATREPVEIIAFGPGECSGELAYSKFISYFPDRGETYEEAIATDIC